MLEKIRKIIADQLSIDENIIQPKTSLVKDLEADSLDFVELVMAIEDAFDVRLRRMILKKLQRFRILLIF